MECHFSTFHQTYLSVLCSSIYSDLEQVRRRNKNYRFLLVPLKSIWEFLFPHKEVICIPFAAWRTNCLSGRNLSGQPEHPEALQIHSRLPRILDGDGLLHIMQKKDSVFPINVPSELKWASLSGMREQIITWHAKQLILVLKWETEIA